MLLFLSACAGGAGVPGASEASRSPNRSVGNVLTAEQIDEQRTATSVLDLLQLIPGVIVRGGAGGGGVQISGRGGTPLFVVNGVPLADASGALGLNPRDISRIEVLRDGGQAAQYGFRGSNGVILISLRR
jgi:TonB-dependent starch-binding outer membrane protein SusC